MLLQTNKLILHLNSCAHDLKSTASPELMFNTPDTILTFTFIPLSESSEQPCELYYLQDFTDEQRLKGKLLPKGTGRTELSQIGTKDRGPKVLSPHDLGCRNSEHLLCPCQSVCLHPKGFCKHYPGNIVHNSMDQLFGSASSALTGTDEGSLGLTLLC